MYKIILLLCVTVALCTAGCATAGISAQLMTNPEQAQAEIEKPVKGLVPERMVCSEMCQRQLDLANGLHKCAACYKKCG